MATAAGISYPDGTFDTSIFDAISQIRGELFSFGLTVDGAISSTMTSIFAMYDAVRALNDNNTWPTLDALVGVWAQLYQLQKVIRSTSRTTKTVLTRADTTLEKFASQVGNKLTEVMGLNTQALRFPIVPKGSMLTYYA
jgi:hypothetical protein